MPTIWSNAYNNDTYQMRIAMVHCFKPFHSGYLETGILANSEHRDEMLPSGCALFATCKIKKHYLRDRNASYFRMFTCIPALSNSILILSKCMDKSIRTKRVNVNMHVQLHVASRRGPSLFVTNR